MMNYLIHSSILLSGFTIFYWLILRNETFFKLNRFTIIFSVILCLSLPLIQIPSAYAIWSTPEKTSVSVIDKIAAVPFQKNLKTPEPLLNEPIKSTGSTSMEDQLNTTSTLSLAKVLSIIYFTGVVIFLLVFVLQLVVLYTRRYNLNTYKTGRYTIVEMVKDDEPYSFLNAIFINPNSYDADTYNHIIEHEKIHIDQSHFVDKIIAEFLVIMFWFNPFTWLLRRSISRNLEFLTDASLIQNGIQKSIYQMSLLKVSVSNKPFNLTMSYNSSFLKTRINMMNSKKSSIVSSWKYLFILPLFIFSMLSLNAVSGHQLKELEAEKASKPMVEHKPELADKNTGILSRTATRNLDLDEISSIGLAVNCNVVIRQGNTQEVRVEGPEDLIDNLNTEVKNGNWNIKFRDKEKVKGSKVLNIFVQIKDLQALALSGSGTIKSENKFNDLDRLSVALSGSGDISMDAEAKFISTAISGSGNISLSGSSQEFKIAISGSGNVRASELSTNDTQIAISGSGNTSVHAEEKLKVAISGNGTVRYSGNPDITADKRSRKSIVKS